MAQVDALSTASMVIVCERVGKRLLENIGYRGIFKEGGKVVCDLGCKWVTFHVNVRHLVGLSYE